MLFVLYNALMSVVDVVILAFLARRRDIGSIVLGVVGAGIAVVGLAILLFAYPVVDQHHSTVFTLFGLLAWGVFLHVPLLLAGAGVILRGTFRRFALTCFVLTGLLIAVAVDSMCIEPHWLEVSRHEIVTSKLTAPVRIVVLADIQTDRVGDYEREVLRLAMDEDPDLILFPGDYVHLSGAERYEAQVQALRAALVDAGLSAPLGIFAVGGNVDRPSWPGVFDGLEVESFIETGSRRTGEIAVTGLSFEDARRPSVSVPPRDAFHIVLGHSPNFSLGDVPADLLVAGHTHGGQVRIPGVGPLMTLSSVPRSWAAGRTELGGDRTLIVSRGIGMERGHAPRLRFCCRPELVVIDLLPAVR